jgi:hypothetical protein
MAPIERMSNCWQSPKEVGPGTVVRPWVQRELSLSCGKSAAPRRAASGVAAGEVDAEALGVGVAVTVVVVLGSSVRSSSPRRRR